MLGLEVLDDHLLGGGGLFAHLVEENLGVDVGAIGTLFGGGDPAALELDGAGFGLGLERMVQFVTGMTNIRDVIPFPRTPKNAEF